jgi:hypothetical protein
VTQSQNSALKTIVRRQASVKCRASHHNGFATVASGGVNGAITPYLAVKPIQVEYVGTSRRSFRSLTKDGKGSSSARAEFGPDCGATGLGPLRTPQLSLCRESQLRRA